MTNKPTLPDQLSLGPATLTVADRARSLAFYRDFLGFELLGEAGQRLTLGVAETPVLQLDVVPGLKPRVQTSTGLYHVAILLPDRVALAQVLQRILDANYPFGASDHFVSEALYLSDPDENGLEIYRDRPRETWGWFSNGLVKMGTEPLDLANILAELPQTGVQARVMPAGTRIGHVHLQVADIGVAKAFYVDMLGFDIVQQMSSALFVSAGRYHHHVGLNTWHSRGAARPPADTANLQSFVVQLPTSAARTALHDRLHAAGIEIREQQQGFFGRRPMGNDDICRTGANRKCLARPHARRFHILCFFTCHRCANCR